MSRFGYPNSFGCGEMQGKQTTGNDQGCLLLWNGISFFPFWETECFPGWTIYLTQQNIVCVQKRRSCVMLNFFFKPCLCSLITGTVWVSTSSLCPFALQRQERGWSSLLSLCTCIWTFPSNESRRTSRGLGNCSSCFIWAFWSKPKGMNMPQLCKKRRSGSYMKFITPHQVCHV